MTDWMSIVIVDSCWLLVHYGSLLLIQDSLRITSGSLLLITAWWQIILKFCSWMVNHGQLMAYKKRAPVPNPSPWLRLTNPGRIYHPFPLTINPLQILNVDFSNKKLNSKFQLQQSNFSIGRACFFPTNVWILNLKFGNLILVSARHFCLITKFPDNEFKLRQSYLSIGCPRACQFLLRFTLHCFSVNYSLAN